MIYRCLCKSKKFMKIVPDGGSGDDYELDMCMECYSSTALQFVISERRIHDPLSEVRD